MEIVGNTGIGTLKKAVLTKDTLDYNNLTNTINDAIKKKHINKFNINEVYKCNKANSDTISTADSDNISIADTDTNTLTEENNLLKTNEDYINGNSVGITFKQFVNYNYNNKVYKFPLYEVVNKQLYKNKALHSPLFLHTFNMEYCVYTEDVYFTARWYALERYLHDVLNLKCF